MPVSIEVCPVQLPGRFNRIEEPAFRVLPDLVSLLVSEIGSYLDKPFAFFGHSMGALVSFELARYLRRTRNIEPFHLIVSGRRAPQLLDDRRPVHSLSEPEFIAELARLQGTPPEVLQHPELMELALPVLRSDFELCERYSFRSEPPLGCPITAFGGTEDVDVSRADLEAWHQQTSSTLSVRMVAGDHFFIHAFEDWLIDQVTRSLLAAPSMLAPLAPA